MGLFHLAASFFVCLLWLFFLVCFLVCCCFCLLFWFCVDFIRHSDGLSGLCTGPPSARPLIAHLLVAQHPLVSFFGMVCPPSGGLVSPCFPLFAILSAHMCACVGWSIRLPEVLSRLVFRHSCLCWMACPPSRGLVSPCLRLFSSVSPHVCLCWMVCPPSQDVISPCLALSSHMCADEC